MKNLVNLMRNQVDPEKEEINERIAAQNYWNKTGKKGMRRLYNNGKPIVKNKKDEKESFTKEIRDKKGYAEHLKNRKRFVL